MKIFVVSDGPQHESGYSRVGRSLCRRMALDGHDVYCYSPGGMAGGEYVWHELDEDGRSKVHWRVMGACFNDDRAGTEGLKPWLEEYGPDLIVTLLDPCTLEAYGHTAAPTWMWAPIDSWPVNDHEMGILHRAEKVICPSAWGAEQLAIQGIEAEHVPYGIETSELFFDEEGRARFRAYLGIPESVYLVGLVGVHYEIPDRKGYPYAFEAIGRLYEAHPNVKAYVQTELRSGERGFLDLRGVRKSMKLDDVIAFSKPSGPRYLSNYELRTMLCGFDVLLQASMCEGFGLPVVEAQACGTPVVINRATSLTELMGPRGCGANPAASMFYQDGTQIAIPDVNGLAQGLEIMYQEWAGGGRLEQVRDSAWARATFDWDMLYARWWRPALEAFERDRPEPLLLDGLKPRLVLGCATHPHEGATNHDRTKHHEYVDVAWDLETFPWPWEDGEWALVDMGDVIEHLGCELRLVMDELWRILAPGGKLLISTVQEGSWQHTMDPTHKRGFTYDSFDYWDPSTTFGREYGQAYTDRPWKIRKKGSTRDTGELLFVLEKIAPIRANGHKVATLTEDVDWPEPSAKASPGRRPFRLPGAS